MNYCPRCGRFCLFWVLWSQKCFPGNLWLTSICVVWIYFVLFCSEINNQFFITFNISTGTNVGYKDNNKLSNNGIDWVGLGGRGEDDGEVDNVYTTVLRRLFVSNY